MGLSCQDGTIFMNILISRTLKTKGTIEMLFLFPLFLTLICGVTWIGFILLQKIRLEQSAWFYVMNRVHQKTRKDSFQRSKTPFYETSSNDSLKMEEKPNCLWAFIKEPNTRLPLAFQTALVSHCPQEVKLTAAGKIPLNISYLFTSLIQGQTSIQNSTLALLPGDSFKDSHFLQQSLWQQAMWEADFGFLPLQMIAIPELLQAAQIVGLGNIGGPAESLLQKYIKGVL